MAASIWATVVPVSTKIDFPGWRAHHSAVMAKSTGLRFSESLSGYLGEGSGFWDAYRDGLAKGHVARFHVTVHIPDLKRFLADPEHVAAMTGRLTVAGLGSAVVDGGRIHLFCLRGQEKRLLYYLPFKKGEGRYLLWGEKRLHKPRGLQAWRQMTTLYTELVRQGDGQPEETLSRGILRISSWEVMRQALSFRPLGTLNPLRFLGDYLRFLRFSGREMRS